MVCSRRPLPSEAPAGRIGHVQPDRSVSRAASARRLLEAVRAELTSLVQDPFFFVMVVVLLLKSMMVVTLINNPDHSALNTAHFEDYETSRTIFVSFIVIPVSLGFLLRGRGRLTYYVALDLALSLLMLVDLWYFRTFSTFLSFLLWQQRTNLEGLRASVLAMFRPIDLLLFADLAVLVPLCLFWRTLYRGTRRAVALALLLPLVATGFLWIKHLELDKDGTIAAVRFVEPCWEARQTISYQSPLGFHVLDFYSVYLRNRPVNLSPAQREQIRSWFAAEREVLPDNRYRALLKGRNLIVVQVESLENFVIGHSVAGQEITPVLNGLLPSSLYFTTIYDQAHEGLSSDSDLMINTSVYPVRKGSTFFRFPDTSNNSLPRILREAGYRKTIAMHPDPGAYWNWRNALIAIGFDACLDMGDFSNDEILGLGLSDADFLPQAAARLLPLPEPFYAFLVTLTSHVPFELPDEDRELKLDTKLDESSLGTAFQCFRYSDRQIGRFLDALRTGGVLERSAVVFYGDHASVHRFLNDEVAALQGTEPWMRDSRTLVPLIVYAPGLAGERFTVIGGHVDIMPTLLDLLGVDEGVTAGTAMGRNLLNTRRDFAVLADGTVVGNDSGTPFASLAVQGLDIADLIISGNYFKHARSAQR